MIDFSKTTAFGLVSRIAAAGTDVPAIYFLISASPDFASAGTDLLEEIQVQTGAGLRTFSASDLVPGRLHESFGAPGITLVTLDRWVPRLIQAIDRNVILLSGGGPVLFLATYETAKRTLAVAPNLRNRLADIAVVEPEETGGAQA